MKHALIAGLVAMSFAVISPAMAKDLSSIDLLSGDYIGVAGLDMDKLATRSVYKKAVESQEIAADYKRVKEDVAKWTKGAFDMEKDADFALVAMPADYDKNEHVVIVESKKDIKPIIPSIDAEIASNDNYERREIDKEVYYVHKRSNEWFAVVDAKRMVVGSEREVKSVMKSKAAGAAAKPVKNNKALYDQYKAANKKTDIWGAFALTSRETKELESIVLDGADGKSFKASNISAGNLDIHFASGLKLNLNAKMKSAEMAADSASVINGVVVPFLSDPALNEMGLGFLNGSLKIASNKAFLTGAVTLSDANLNALLQMAKEMGGQYVDAAKKGSK